MLQSTRLILSLFLLISIATSFAINRFAKKLVEQSEMSEDVEEKRKLV